MTTLLAWWKKLTTRKLRPGDRWTDASGRVHILTAHDEDGIMTTDGVVL
jgi:hypothetical protein